MFTNIRKPFTFLFVLLVLFYSWITAQHFPHNYDYVFAIRSTLGVMALGYLLLRARKSAKLTKSPAWGAVLALVAYWGFQSFRSPDPEISFPRLFLFLSFVLFFAFIWDLLDSYLDHRVVLVAFLFGSGLFMLATFFEVYQSYQAWWDVFGFRGESPPIPYRFISIVGHSNVFSAFLNLLAPVAVVLFLRRKSLRVRVILLVWFGAYIACIYLSSSRGGLLGAVAGLGILLTGYLLELRLIEKFRALPNSRKILLLVLAAAVFIVGAFLGFRVLTAMSSHPTHGGGEGTGINLNRGNIWRGYIDIFLDKPLFGIGLGYHPIAFLKYTDIFPPAFWPLHAHNVPITILAETGLVGVALIGALVIFGVIKMIQAIRSQTGDDRHLSIGLLAGLGAIAVQAIFEDFLVWPIVVIPALMWIAWILTVDQKPARYEKIPQATFLIPVVVLLVWGGVQAQPNKYLSRALTSLGQEQWDAAAQHVLDNRAVFTDSPFYSAQAGLILANSWRHTGEDRYLHEANTFLARTLEQEANVSLFYASKAALSWQIGEEDQAVSEIEAALSLSPYEAAYHLNLGWFYEQMGATEQASEAYISALDLSKNRDWAAHPFWQLTSTRTSVLGDWLAENAPVPSALPYITAGFEAIMAGDIQAAQKNLLRADWLGEHYLGTQFLEAIIEMELDQDSTAVENLQRSYASNRTIRRNLIVKYAQNYYVDGISIDFVPGFIHLYPEVGQSQIAPEVFDYLLEHAGCEEAHNMWVDFQISIHGGELIQVAEQCQ